MAVRTLLRMGDARLLQPAAPVGEFGARLRSPRSSRTCSTPWPRTRCRPGRAAIGVGLQVVIFGFERSEQLPGRRAGAARHPAEPVIVPLTEGAGRAGRAACRCPACAAWCRAPRASRCTGYAPAGEPIRRFAEGFHARGAAQVRPPRRRAVSDAGAGFPPLRVYGRAVFRAAGIARGWLYPQDGGGGPDCYPDDCFDHVQRVVR